MTMVSGLKVRAPRPAGWMITGGQRADDSALAGDVKPSHTDWADWAAANGPSTDSAAALV